MRKQVEIRKLVDGYRVFLPGGFFGGRYSHSRYILSLKNSQVPMGFLWPRTRKLPSLGNFNTLSPARTIMYSPEILKNSEVVWEGTICSELFEKLENNIKNEIYITETGKVS